MNSGHLSQTNAEPVRGDVYSAPHKALRFMLANLVVAMGRASFGDPRDVASILAELGAVLSACDGHVEHEDRHLRPALAERAPSATVTLDDEHADHLRQAEELRAIASALREEVDASARIALGSTLYLHFSVFVAESLRHMAYEERVVQPLLDRLFSAAELGAIQQAIVGSIPPAQMFVFLRAMIPASNREERAVILARIKATAPPQAFTGLLDETKGLLGADDWADLAERLGQPVT